MLEYLEYYATHADYEHRAIAKLNSIEHGVELFYLILAFDRLMIWG